MEIAGIGIFAIIGFLFAAYAVVGNDALQTLGTFINSNSRLHWFWLFLFAGFILVATFTYGWIINEGDPSWERLANAKKYPVPPEGIQWYHTLPPLMLLVITRFGVPVSTSFMVLTVFASIGGLTSMLSKSLIGYGLAFAVGLVIYLLVTNTLEKYFREHPLTHRAPWGLATGMGILIALAIIYVPPLITGAPMYGWQAGAVIISLGLLVDLFSLAAHERFTNIILDAVIALVIGVIFWFYTSLLLPEEMVEGTNGLIIAKTITLYFHWLSIGIGALMGLFAFWIAMSVRAENSIYWILLQWITTAYLWGVWLIQDFANIFVFLPRELTALQGFLGLAAILLLLGYTFWNKGGPVQRILQAKTSVTDIRSATLIDFSYASLLFLFKEVSDIPMSTTFVFLGLIAGREFGFAIMDKAMNVAKAAKLGVSDASKAYIGLVLSINMAVGLPLLSKYIQAQAINDTAFVLADHLPNQSFTIFIIAANILLLPVAWFLMKQESRQRMFVTAGCLLTAAAVFFVMPPQEDEAEQASYPISIESAQQ